MAHSCRTDITPDRVRQVLDYNPETGVFVWKGRPRSMFQSAEAWKNWNHRFAGQPAGYGRKYVKIQIFSKIYSASRLAYLLTYGEWPEGYMKDKAIRKPEGTSKAKLRGFEDFDTAQNVNKP